MRHSLVNYIFIACTLIFKSGVAQYDDEVSSGKLRLQDLENEQNLRDYQRQKFERLQQQQPPLPPGIYNRDKVSPIASSLQHQQSNLQTAYRHVPQSVRPLEQVISPAKPLRPSGIDYVSAAANNNNLGINPLTGNTVDEVSEGDIDSDIVTYSHAVPSLPFHLRRPQLELLSGGGAGYSLSAVDVLLPPFREENINGISDERRRLPQLPPGRYIHPLPDISNRVLPNYGVNEVSAPLQSPSYITSNELPEPPAGTVEYASGYPQLSKFSLQRPPIQYGTPQAAFRRPTFYGQSNQFTYSPMRPEGGSLISSPGNIPYPPSFISITTQRPKSGYTNSGPNPVLPLGRSIGYKNQFRPSPIDPVPDLFTNRQSKSLLDSYIPSWIVEKALSEQRNNSPGYNGYSGYFKRSLIAPNKAQDRKDVVNMENEKSNDETEKKIVKKSLGMQVRNTAEQLMMTV